jgi:hypothetical protein
MLVVDLLHEFELGVWKAILTHLIRLLYAAAPAGRLVTELDRRYVDSISGQTTSPQYSRLTSYTRFHLIPTFGRSTIRKFHTNTSEMKRLAARNFEDILQVCCGSSIYQCELMTLRSTISSVRSRYLKASFQSLTTRS